MVSVVFFGANVFVNGLLFSVTFSPSQLLQKTLFLSRLSKIAVNIKNEESFFFFLLADLYYGSVFV